MDIEAPSKVKILHVASFSGNIGDIANHFGFRTWFETLLNHDIEWVNFEIRKVFRKQSAFDEAFVALANSCDLIVIGGGNFFELWVETSPTGTSISIDKEHFDKIKRPIFFNALGVDDGMGTTVHTIHKFNEFLSRLLSSEQYLVTVRNDGALDTLHRHVTNKGSLSKVISVPDPGFFAVLNSTELKKHPATGVTHRIGINLAGDMVSTRFSGVEGHHDYQGFLKEFCNLLIDMWNDYPNLKIVLFAHIYKDLKVYTDILDMLPDELVRNDVRLAPYDSNVLFENTAFKEYTECTVILGMRFHANVMAIANHIPAIGLLSYKQIDSLFDELNFKDYLVDVRLPGFKSKILKAYGNIVEHSDKTKCDLDKVISSIRRNREMEGLKLSTWLKRHGFALSQKHF